MEVLNLNCIPVGSNPVVHASQYDVGRVFRFNLFDGSNTYTLDGTETIECNVRKLDGNVVTVGVTNTSSDYIDIVTTAQMTAIHGQNYGEIVFKKNGDVIGSINFILAVEQSPLEGGITSDSVIYNLQVQVANYVANEVATQYDSANVIFDNAPTSGHGTPYTVTSEGIKTAIDNAFDYDNTASGSIVHIEDGADNIPVKSLSSEIVAVQSGSGTPSPSNPRAISGFANGVVPVCRKNFLPNTITTQTKNAVTFTVNSDGTITTSGTANAEIDLDIGTVYLKAGSYKLSGCVGGGWGTYLIFCNDINPAIANYSDDTNITLSVDTELRFRIIIRSGKNTNGLTFSPMIRKSTDSNTFEQYNGNTYTFAFGQTVYGGHFNNKGNLVVTHGFIDLGTISWNTGTANRSKTTALASLIKIPSSTSSLCGAIGEKCFEVSANSSLNTDGQFAVLNTGELVFYRNVDTPTGLFVYPLATPQAISITNQDIPTLLGENNIFSNCGNVTVEYYTEKANDVLNLINSEIGKKNGTNILIEANSPDSIKTYIDNEVSNINLDDLSDTDITTPSSGQVLSFDGNNWVNTNQIVVKYEEKDIAFDSSGEGTLYFANGYILGLKDIPSDSLYIGYITYMAGNKTMVKGFNRSATSFDSSVIINTTRKIGIYYLDYITTQ